MNGNSKELVVGSILLVQGTKIKSDKVFVQEL